MGWADTVSITPLSPEPTQRSGRIRAVRITSDDGHVVFTASSPRHEPAQLFATALTLPHTAPIRINRPLLGTESVTHFDLAGDGTTILYLAAETLFERDELFSYDLGTGARRRLSTPLDSSGTGDVDWFTVSPDRAWIVYETSNAPSGLRDFHIVPVDGSIPARRLPYPPLPDFHEGYAFTGDGNGLVLVDETSTPARLFSFNMGSGQLAPLDALPPDEAWTYRAGRADPATGLFAIRLSGYLPPSIALHTRHRVVDPGGSIPARWIGEIHPTLDGATVLPDPARLLLVGKAADTGTTTVSGHDLATGAVTSWELPLNASLGDYFAANPIAAAPAESLKLDRTRELFFYSAGPDRRYLRLGDGAEISLSSLADDAGLIAAGAQPFFLIPDETGRVHFFFAATDGTWWLDLAPGEADAPVRIAPFAATAIAAINAAADRVIIQSIDDSSDTSIRDFHLASITGSEPSRLLGGHHYEWFDPAPAYLTRHGAQLLFPRSGDGLVLTDLDQPAGSPRLVSPPWAVVSQAHIASESPDRSHALIRVDDELYLSAIATGQLRNIASGQFPSWSIRWSPDGRWMFLRHDEPEIWQAIDTADQFASRTLADEYYDRMVGIGADHQVVHARGGQDLSFYVTDLRTGEIRELGTLPRPPGNAVRSPGFGLINADGDTLALTIATGSLHEVWLVPLQGAPPAALVNGAGLGDGIGVLGLDSTHVYLSTYEAAIHAVARDGSGFLRLSETAPAGGGMIGATDIQLDLERRLVVYASSYPDGVRRLHRRSLDAPDELGFAAEIFPLEGWLPTLSSGAVLCEHDRDTWYVGAAPGSAPVRLTSHSDFEYTDQFALSPDGLVAFLVTGGPEGQMIHRHDLADGTRARLTPPAVGWTGGFIQGADDREIWFSGELESPWVSRIYRARLAGHTLPPDDGLDHPGYASWVIDSALPNGLEAAAEDADGDGNANLLEYIHRSDADDANARPGFSFSLQSTAEGSWELAYAFAAFPREARVRPQYSPDLTTWFDIPGLPPRTLDASSAPDLRWPLPPLSTSRIFFRLRFDLP